MAYVWIVNQTADGNVTISVQGETSFPKLTGRWSPDQRALILTAVTTKAFSKLASWAKLTVNSKGELVGVRRVVQDGGGANQAPCFADANVVARKQG